MTHLVALLALVVPHLDRHGDPRTGARRKALEMGLPDRFEWAFGPGGLWLAVGTRGGELLLFDAQTGTRLGTWTGHRDEIVTVRFAGPGRVLTGSADLTALL